MDKCIFMLFGACAQTSQHSEVEIHSYTIVKANKQVKMGYQIRISREEIMKGKQGGQKPGNPPNQKSQDGSYVNEFRIRYFKCAFQLNNLGQVTGLSRVSIFLSVKWG